MLLPAGEQKEKKKKDKFILVINTIDINRALPSPLPVNSIKTSLSFINTKSSAPFTTKYTGMIYSKQPPPFTLRSTPRATRSASVCCVLCVSGPATAAKPLHPLSLCFLPAWPPGLSVRGRVAKSLLGALRAGHVRSLAAQQAGQRPAAEASKTEGGWLCL